MRDDARATAGAPPCCADRDAVAPPDDAEIAAIHPVVLVGGRSTRFGRDKLVEPLPAEVSQPCSTRMLVERPIAVLRSVFGPRVKLVGACDPRVAACGDGVIADRYPGIGPIGGILSALEACGGAVFVLAGDMPSFDDATVRAIVRASGSCRFSSRTTEPTCEPRVLVAMAYTDRLHPCAALYRFEAFEMLSLRMRSGRFSLIDAFPAEHRRRVRCDPRVVRNVNTPGDLQDA